MAKPSTCRGNAYGFSIHHSGVATVLCVRGLPRRCAKPVIGYAIHTIARHPRNDGLGKVPQGCAKLRIARHPRNDGWGDSRRDAQSFALHWHSFALHWHSSALHWPHPAVVGLGVCCMHSQAGAWERVIASAHPAFSFVIPVCVKHRFSWAAFLLTEVRGSSISKNIYRMGIAGFPMIL